LVKVIGKWWTKASDKSWIFAFLGG